MESRVGEQSKNGGGQNASGEGLNVVGEVGARSRAVAASMGMAVWETQTLGEVGTEEEPITEEEGMQIGVSTAEMTQGWDNSRREIQREDKVCIYSLKQLV